MRHMAYLLLLLPLAACSTGAAAGTLATRADSAGITIVTNTDPSWRPNDGWQISVEPLVHIGHRDDDDPWYDFLRVGTGRLMSNGGFVIAVAGHYQLRRFSSAGEWAWTAGREGDGPGEMRLPGGVKVSGDTVFLADNRLQRVTSFIGEGIVHDAWRYPTNEAGRRITPAWRLADGRWIGSTAGTRVAEPPSGYQRNVTDWYGIDAGLTRTEKYLATTLGPEHILESGQTFTESDGTVRQMSLLRFPVLARSTVTTASAHHLIVGDNIAPELRVFSPDDSLVMLIRWPAPGIRVDAALLERIKQGHLARAPDDPRARVGIEAQYSAPTPADVVPYFNSVQVDASGAIWLEAYPLVPGDSVRYQIFAPDGQWLGARALPPATTVLDIGLDRILAVWRDNDDLEYVRVYGLRR